MKRLLILLLVLIAGCGESVTTEPSKTLLVYIGDVHIATLSAEMKLVSIEEDDDLKMLKTDINDIQIGITITREVKDADGDYVLEEVQISQDDPDYLYAIQKELEKRGYNGRIE